MLTSKKSNKKKQQHQVQQGLIGSVFMKSFAIITSHKMRFLLKIII